jgi:acetyltransferase-like isoleucine patch superfamily enzyme
MSEFIRLIARNPVTEYLRYLADLVIHSARYDDFHQGYLSQVRHCVVEAHARIGQRAIVADSRIGSYSYIGHNCVVQRTELGRFCSIAAGCRIGLSKHPSRGLVSTHPAFFDCAGELPWSFVDRKLFEGYGRITIGNDVWIGTNVLIVDGVSIGNGAIIGAGAVVVKSVPDYAVYGGVPARLLRYRFEPSEIAWLNSFRWWDRDEQWLRAHAEAFQDIQALMRVSGKALDPEFGAPPTANIEDGQEGCS